MVYKSRKQKTLGQQLYEAFKMGQFTATQYTKLKKASDAAKKKALSGNKKNYKSSTPVKLAKVTRQVKNIQYQLKNDMASHINRRILSGQYTTNFNDVTYHTHQLGTAANWIEASMNKLRYFDPASPATLVTADASTGLYSRQITINNISSTTKYVNNSLTSIVVTIYECKVREDTGILPTNAMTNGIADQFVPPVTLNSHGIYPSDINQLNELWTVKKKGERTLKPGDSYTTYNNTGKFTFDPSVLDSHTLNYQKQWKSATDLIRLEGIVGHDLTQDVGTENGTLDYVQQVTTSFTYDAGTSLKDYSILNDLPILTAPVVTVNKPSALAQNN